MAAPPDGELDLYLFLQALGLSRDRAFGAGMMIVVAPRLVAVRRNSHLLVLRRPGLD